MLINVGHSHLFVLGSLIVAVMGAFTALRLTSNLRHIPIETRKVRVSQGAFALGISIWSMHFIAMLAINLPVAISYDPLPTLASALISVLVVGLAFLSLHFGERSRKTILIAGTLTGFGIATMHYLGMSAISQNVIVSYSSYGVVLAIGVGIVASTAALELAYGDRTLLNISIGSVMLGLAISAMHHTGMYFTDFYTNPQAVDIPASLLDNDKLALIVMVSSFVLCGMFLLLAFPSANNLPAVGVNGSRDEQPSGAGFSDGLSSQKVPYEQNSVVKYIPADNIHAVRADGHYTSIYDGVDELFCPWSISQMKERLNSQEFVSVHRSFLVNKNHIIGLKRDGDKTFCVIDEDSDFKIPVARSQIAGLRLLLQSS